MEELICQLILPDYLDNFSKICGDKQNVSPSAPALLQFFFGVGEKLARNDVVSVLKEELPQLLHKLI